LEERLLQRLIKCMDTYEEWLDDDSEIFSRYADYFVPERRTQIDIITQLLSSVNPLDNVVELGCGQGSLSESILEAYPYCKVLGLDASEAMLKQASESLFMYGNRFIPQKFDLKAADWLKDLKQVDAFVSSLAIHQLVDAEKKNLFKNVFKGLKKNGAFVIADIVQPTTSVGQNIAGAQWDRAVQKISQTMDGNLNAFEAFKMDDWNYYDNPKIHTLDKPATLYEQLTWLMEAGFGKVDVFWMQAGHAIFGGWKLSE
jgi:tRNA (cmo5U34)-methyltransferase